MRQNLLFITFALITLNSCSTDEKNTRFEEKQVQIEGNIENYKGIYKTGQLTYFDAVTRIVKDETFDIDSTGNFKVTFNLLHPIIGSIYLDLENNFYSDFYIEPGIKYSVLINGDTLTFYGETGKINNQISVFYDSLNSKLGAKIQEINTLHNEGLEIEEYLSFQKVIEREKSDFLDAFNRNSPFPEKVYNMLKKEIEFKTAHAWINYRFDYTTPNSRILKDKLPANFYKKLFKEYPIVDDADYQSRNCIDYISNVVSVLTQKDSEIDRKIVFIKKYNYFTPSELEMLSKLYNGDTVVRNSNMFAAFNTPENMSQVRKLLFRYDMNNFLKNITQLEQNIGRDLIISQAISKNYFSNNLFPTTSEWQLLDSLVGDPSILNYLHSLSDQNITEKNHDKIINQNTNTSIKEVREKYIDKYFGKVIYIDFYTTWCSPCRAETPFAKALQHEFRNSDVVFLNLCARSKIEDWEFQLKQKELEGENYLLNNEEFNFLSKLYNVEGFPTYVLIDKKGYVANYEAPRPSSKRMITAEINKLLE